MILRNPGSIPSESRHRTLGESHGLVTSRLNLRGSCYQDPRGGSTLCPSLNVIKPSALAIRKDGCAQQSILEAMSRLPPTAIQVQIRVPHPSKLPGHATALIMSSTAPLSHPRGLEESPDTSPQRHKPTLGSAQTVSTCQWFRSESP